MTIQEGQIVEVEISVIRSFGCFAKILQTDQDGLIRNVDMVDSGKVSEELMPPVGKRLFAKIMHISTYDFPKISLNIKPSETGVDWASKET